MSQFKAVILGASAGKRFVDSSKSTPSVLTTVEKDRSVLSWIRQALNGREISDTVYVGGYHIEKVVDNAPDLSFVFQKNWQSEGDLGAFNLVKLEQGNDYLVLRGDFVLLPGAVDRLLEMDLPVVFGATNTSGQVSITGAVLVRATGLREFSNKVGEIFAQNPKAGLSDLAGQFQTSATVDLSGEAAFVQDQLAVSRLVFRGKGQTLEQLRQLTRTAIVLEQTRFTVAQWRDSRQELIDCIQQEIPDGPVVVRSSSTSEDLLSTSGAGRFQSILDVNVRDSVQIAQAVDTVIESYTRDGRTVKDADEILVQPQVTDVASSGVMFSRDLEIKAPYHTINIDRHSKRPDVVTSGTAGHLDTSFVAWNADRDLLPDDIRRLVCLAEELMELTQLDALDIEFLFDSRQELYLLQVRPMPLGHSSYSLADTDLLDTVSEARRFIAQNSGPSPILAGSTTIFGNMPDWNPAEMIGKTPRPLALSLYQALIGDFHWASARADIGYRDVTPEPLVVAIGGKPYIDVRTSLNSFLPASIDREFAGAWIDDCLARLAARPELHDKVEFEVLPTCLAFDWDVHHGHMRAAGLSASAIDQYRAQLAKLTSTILRDREIPISKLLADVQGLESIHQLRRQDGADSAGAFARRAQLLLIDCGRYGLRPFSILARYAFISLAILKSLVSSGVLSRSDMDRFLQSIPTVASEFTSDLEALRSGAMSKELFVEQYGHLRPNSYEITSPNYASGFERYIGQGEAGLFAGNDCKPGRFEPNASNEADRALQSLGLEVSAGQLFEFMRAAIAGREKAKFEFMKSVNSILESITKFGEFIGLSTGELSHLHVNEVLQHAKSSMNGSSASHLKRQASFKKKQMEVTRAFRTPDLIRHADEVLYFEQETWKPNFVTQKTLQAEVVDLPGEPDNRNLEGKIVLIQAADPGYDWIFGHRIAGLITEYGGIGSHMAIRAAEFSLPAAIGCGGVLFEQVRNARRVELDCANERLKVLA